MSVSGGVTLDLSTGVENTIPDRASLPATPRLGEVYFIEDEALAVVCIAAGPPPTWSDLGGGNAVYVSDVSNEVPGTPGTGQTAFTFPAVPLHEGDLFLNRVDGLSWTYIEDPATPGTTIWEPLSSAGVTVTIGSNIGSDPATFTFPVGYTAKSGDLFVAPIDGRTWVYDADIGDFVLASRDVIGWNPGTEFPAGSLVTEAGELYIALQDVVGTPPPSNPASFGIWDHIGEPTVTVEAGVGDAPAGHTFTSPPGIGDTFVNPTDGKAWVYGPDHANPGQHEWVEIAPESAHVETTAGETPVTAGVAAREGDIWINRTDGTVWVGVPDALAPGNVWESLPTGGDATVTISPTAGEEPGTFTFPDAPATGDTFINREDGKTWVYGPDATLAVMVWEPVPARGAVTYIGPDVPVAPFDAANGYGWGAAVAQVTPNPVDVPPEPNDTWIAPSVGKMGVFSATSALATSATPGQPGTFLPPTARVPANVLELDLVAGGAAWTTGGDYIVVNGIDYFWDGIDWLPGRVAAPAPGVTPGQPGTWDNMAQPADLLAANALAMNLGAAWTTVGDHVLTGDGRMAYWDGTQFDLGPVPAAIIANPVTPGTIGTAIPDSATTFSVGLNTDVTAGVSNFQIEWGNFANPGDWGQISHVAVYVNGVFTQGQPITATLGPGLANTPQTVYLLTPTASGDVIDVAYIYKDGRAESGRITVS